MKRMLDVIVSACLLAVLSPLIGTCALLIWLHDRHSPFYLAERVGRGDSRFKIVKLRSMVVNADKTGVSSTKKDDDRITPVGKFVRRVKLDELTQLWNVLRGEMSMVGPRPNVYAKGVERYTPAERRLLDVRPGITDISSIVFADEGDILAGAPDPDEAYDQLIRPWKSRLGLFYIDHCSVLVDVQLILLTALGVLSRGSALQQVAALLRRLGAAPDLVEIALRNHPLQPLPPYGA